MPLPTVLSRLSLSTNAEARVTELIDRLDAKDVDAVSDVLLRAAESDGDWILSDQEVGAVVDAFDQVDRSSAALTRQKTSLALVGAEDAVGRLEDAANVNGVRIHFSDALERRLIDELQAAVARAAGRPIDINMAIFEFQSDAIEKAIADIAQAHKNATFYIVGDSGQASDVGGNALPSLLKLKLPNVHVKYKKDYPYIWDKQQQRPVYSHTATKGLNHHKGFVTTIDGALDRLVTGSFNWSKTADTKNYEDLAIVHAKDSNTRRLIGQFHDELAGFFNTEDAALSPNAFAEFKRQQLDAMRVKNGLPPRNGRPQPVEAPVIYTPRQDDWSFDLNGYRAHDGARLEKLVGKALAKDIADERERHGRFTSFSELEQRVPAVARLAAKTKAVVEHADYGSGRVSVNTASQDELEGAGFTAAAAAAIVAQREQRGDFDDLSAVGKVRGVGATAVAKIADRLDASDAEAFFNSRPFSAAAAGTGYGTVASARTTAVRLANGTVGAQPAEITWGAVDFFNGAKSGDTISVAMYGMSPSSPESKALEAAAKRGAKVRVVVNDSGTDTAVAALEAWRKAGLDVEVRIQRAKTMHEKFGVVGDDVFFGSANFSESSSTKHSENRVTLKNQPRLARRFSNQFDLLWSKSKSP